MEKSADFYGQEKSADFFVGGEIVWWDTSLTQNQWIIWAIVAPMCHHIAYGVLDIRLQKWWKIKNITLFWTRVGRGNVLKAATAFEVTVGWAVTDFYTKPVYALGNREKQNMYHDNNVMIQVS